MDDCQWVAAILDSEFRLIFHDGWIIGCSVTPQIIFKSHKMQFFPPQLRWGQALPRWSGSWRPSPGSESGADPMRFVNGVGISNFRLGLGIELRTSNFRLRSRTSNSDSDSDLGLRTSNSDSVLLTLGGFQPSLRGLLPGQILLQLRSRASQPFL